MVAITDEKFLDVFETIQDSLSSQTDFLRSLYKLETKRFEFEREKMRDAAREKALQVQESKKEEARNRQAERVVDNNQPSNSGFALFAGLGGLIGSALGALSPASLGRLLIRGPMLGVMAPAIGSFVGGAVEEALDTFNPGGAAGDFNNSIAEAMESAVTYGLIGSIFGRRFGAILGAFGLASSFGDEIFRKLDEDNDGVIRAFGLAISEADFSLILGAVAGAIVLALPSLIKRGLGRALTTFLATGAVAGAAGATRNVPPNPANRATSQESLDRAARINDARTRFSAMTPEELLELENRGYRLNRAGIPQRLTGEFIPDNEMFDLLDDIEARRIRSPSVLGRLFRGLGRAAAVVPFATAAMDEQAQETDMGYMATVAKEFALGLPAIVDLASMLGAEGSNLLFGTDFEGTDLYNTANNYMYDTRRENIDRFGAAYGTPEAREIAEGLLEKLREDFTSLSDEQLIQFNALGNGFQREEYGILQRRYLDELDNRNYENRMRMEDALDLQELTGRGFSVGPTSQELQEFQRQQMLTLDALIQVQQLENTKRLEAEQMMRDTMEYINRVGGGNVAISTGGNVVKAGDTVSTNNVTIIAPTNSSTSLDNGAGVITSFSGGR